MKYKTAVRRKKTTDKKADSLPNKQPEPTSTGYLLSIEAAVDPPSEWMFVPDKMSQQGGYSWSIHQLEGVTFIRTPAGHKPSEEISRPAFDPGRWTHKFRRWLGLLGPVGARISRTTSGRQLYSCQRIYSASGLTCSAVTLAFPFPPVSHLSLLLK